MEAKDREIKEFVTGKDVVFTIPSYQRKYTWEFKNEISILLSDIQEFIDDNDRVDYFLGSIIVQAIPSLSKSFLLVDGQQRITTFLLIISAIRNCIKNDGTFKYKVESILETERGKFKLNRINDQSTIEKILNNNDNQLTSYDKETKYYKVYSELIKFFKNKENEEKGWIEKFFDKGISNIILAIIMLNEKEDEFLVFESINSKGKNLNSGDLIKNYVMMQFIYQKESKKLERDFENNIIEQLKEKELLDFYRQIIALKTGKLISKNGKSLYYKFKEIFKKENINEDFIKYLKNKLSIWKYIDETDFGYKSYPLIKTGLLNYYGIISTIVERNSNFHNNEIEITNYDEIEKAINKMSLIHILRTLGGRGRVESNRTFASLANEYYLSHDMTFNDVIEKLKNWNGKTRTPTWGDVEEQLFVLDVYSNKNIIKSIFIALEEHQSHKKIEFSKISIEHIYPQNPSEDWVFETKEEENEMKLLLNTLGNISITNDNSAMGNKIFKKKREILEDRSYLKINKMVYEIDEWNPTELKKRAQKILQYIKEIWD